jgi:hypothetical protein
MDLVSDLSEDAWWWRTWGVIKLEPHIPVRLFFKFVEGQPAYSIELLYQLATLLKEPYITDDYERASAIVVAPSEEEADVLVRLAEDFKEILCLRYELVSRHTGENFEVGWFRLFEESFESEMNADSAESNDRGI